MVPWWFYNTGLGSNSKVWNAIAPDLVETQGFGVLRYYLYDRGYSETDPERYPITKVGCHPVGSLASGIYRLGARGTFCGRRRWHGLCESVSKSR